MTTDAKNQQRVENIHDYNSLDLMGLSVHYFWSDASGTCHIMTPILDQLSAHYKDKVYMYSINIDHNNDIANSCGINQLPTILIYAGSQLVDCIAGIISLNDLIHKIDRLLAE